MACGYRLAGRSVVADVALEPLVPFARSATVAVSPPPASRVDRGAAERVYRGLGWVGGRTVEVESLRHSTGYLLRVAGLDELEVSADGAWIVRRGEPAEPIPALVETVLGPGLVLALALQDVWCLHAGAAVGGGQAVALVGESGAGKSTLTAALGARGWRRMADDLLPVALRGAGVVALPRFPQLKLAASRQWRSPRPDSVPLAAAYLLEPDAPAIEVDDLSPRQRALTLVRHTVAARLFDRDLQARHLERCTELARRLTVRVVRFPRRRERLAEVTAAIDADLSRRRPPGRPRP